MQRCGLVEQGPDGGRRDGARVGAGEQDAAPARPGRVVDREDADALGRGGGHAASIHVTCVEPGPYATGFGTSGLRRSTPIPAYDAVRASLDLSGWQLGDPAATRPAILAVVDADEPPARVVFGRALEGIEADYAERLRTWRAWQPVSLAAFGTPGTTASTLA